ncbi:valine--tRNA ligase [Candidatus Saccharibacteria bacterium]|nr:valine--tRNA ligase [Candidatus Saccharibacteria bacterium]
MSLDKVYDPQIIEADIYALWESAGVFDANSRGSSEARPKARLRRPSDEGVSPSYAPYSIVMPPPNANGNLHIGHGLTVALEDILTRYHRSRGRDTVYIPGADHAGFETWVVYEKSLEGIGKSRFDYTRDELYAQVWDFVAKQRGNMEIQLRALGASCDWKHLTFTLDQNVVRTVYKTFQQMFEDGLVYRGEKIVNYCTKHQTSFADIEVVYREEAAKMWDIAYPLLADDTTPETLPDGSPLPKEIIISTTRPETLLGDTAVAVNSKDGRYSQLVGLAINLPLMDRDIPIIADDYVDPLFGTGAVKITPAHDPNDAEIGLRHSLDAIQVIGTDGHMTDLAGPDFAGLPYMEARDKVLQALENQGLLRGERDITHKVPHCYKCDAVIQPLLKEQWFVQVAPLAKRAVEALEQGEVKFFPAQKKDELINYYKHLRDWNISRQIPWGIPIPMFQNEADPEDWIFDNRVGETELKIDGKTYVRDEDTFDTWFSSGQWPFVTTDVLEQGDLAKYYPLSVMETGVDILYPWISRMLMLGLYATDQVPFKEVYLHGMVLDPHGKKMSKSKGNVINPLDVVAEFGSDAFRFGIVSARSAGQPQAFSLDKVIAGRNLCNKLWNLARYVSSTAGENGELTLTHPHEHWVIGRLTDADKKLESLIADYRFAEAAELVYGTIWNEVADWFIEASKAAPNPALLRYVLGRVLEMSHPFLPFVTEAIWQSLPWTDALLADELHEEYITYDIEKAQDFKKIQKLVTEIRFVQADLPDQGDYGLIYGADDLIAANVEVIQKLAKLPKVEQGDPTGIRLANSGRKACLNVPAKIVEKYAENIIERIKTTEAEITHLEARLSNQSYLSKAPESLVEESRAILKLKQDILSRLARQVPENG